MVLTITLCLPLFTVSLAASAPSAPQSLTAVAGDWQIGLFWFAPANDGGAAITGYQVSMDGGATWTDVGLATSYTYTGLAGGKTYVFMVRAVNSAGSGDEAIASAKPKDNGSSTGQGNQPGQGQGTGGGGGGGQQVEPPKPPDTPVKPQDKPPDKPPVEPQDKPADEPPPQAEPPQPEDYIPVEIDPAEVVQKPFRPKRAQIKKQAGTYMVVASGKLSRIYDAYVKLTFTLDFYATKAGDNMYGSYTGNGSLYEELDSAYWQAAVRPDATNEHIGGGPLTDIHFGLYVPVGDGPFTPLPPLVPAGNADSGLTPLPPINLSTQAEGKGTMYWNASDIKNLVTSPYSTGHNTPFSPQSLNFDVIIYENGNGIVKLNYRGGSLYFPARLVKNVKPQPQPAPGSTNSSVPLQPLQPATGNDNTFSPLPPLLPATGH